LFKLVLLSLEGQNMIDPFDEEEAEGSRVSRKAGPQEVPINGVKDAGSPVVVFREVGTLCQGGMELAELRGDVMCQGSTLHREGDQASWEEWYQRSWMLNAFEFISGQFITSDIQLCWPW
jgi:hypothetical protein